MPGGLELLLEAERRGILPDDKKGMLTEARQRGLVPGGSAQATPAAPEAPPPSMGLGEMASSAVQNVPGSALQFAKDVTAPIHSPIETVKGLGGLGAGVLEKQARVLKNTFLGSEDAPGENEQKLEALASFVGDRYGGIEEIKRTIAEDPVGVLSDIAGLLMGGGGAAVKAAGTAGKVSNVASRVGKAGRAIDPARLASAGAKGAGRAASTAASEIFGLTTGAQATPLKVAFKGGRQGGAKGKAFLESVKGDVPMDQVVEQARAAVGNMHKRKMDAYREGLNQVFSERPEAPTRPPRKVTGARESSLIDPTTNKPMRVTTTKDVPVGEIDFQPIQSQVNTLMKAGAFKGVDISKSTAAMRKNIKAIVKKWEKLDPEQYHTVEGMDAMRKSIGDLVDSAPFNTPERRLANQAYFTVRKTIEAQAPGYGKVMKGYHEASKHLKDLERGLSLGKSAATETALRKLQAVMRNDVTSAYGKRAEYAKELAGAGAGNLESTLAGQALQPWMPRALASRLGGLGTGAAGASGMISPYALPLVAAASPRIVGMGAYRAGQASRPLAGLAEIMSKLPTGTGQASFQAGRASRESGR